MNAVELLLLLSVVLAGSTSIFFFMKLKDARKELQNISSAKLNYENITQQANDPMLVIDIVNGKLYTANPKLSQLLGYAHDQLLKYQLFANYSRTPKSIQVL